MLDNVLESFEEMTHLLILSLKRLNHCEILSLLLRDKITSHSQFILSLLLLFKIQLIIELALDVIYREARVDFSHHSTRNTRIDACIVFLKLTSNVRICVDVFSKSMKLVSSSFESIIKDFATVFDA